MSIKKCLGWTAAILISSFGAASAADLTMPLKAPPAPAAAPSMFDIAFGTAVMNDYNFRGITQSAHNASVAGYFEPRFNIAPNVQLYAGLSAESLDFPNHAAAEVDFYAGIRPTFGPLSFDFGVWYYDYPGGITFNGLGAATTCTNLFFTPTGGCNVLKGDVSFWELYGKTAYTFNDYLTIGANVFYDPNWLNSGAPGTYVSGTFKVTAPATMLPNGIGAYVSGELGHYWLGTTGAFYGVPAFPAGINLPDYTTWNLGLAFTYKVFTLDLRYYDTDLSKGSCNVLTGDHTATFNVNNISAINPSGLGSNWCGSSFVAKLSADITLAQLK